MMTFILPQGRLAPPLVACLMAVATVHTVGTSLVLEVPGAILGGKEPFLCYNQLHKDIMGTVSKETP